MDEVQVNVENGRGIRLFGNNVRFPHLFKKGLWHNILFFEPQITQRKKTSLCVVRGYFLVVSAELFTAGAESGTGAETSALRSQPSGMVLGLGKGSKIGASGTFFSSFEFVDM